MPVVKGGVWTNIEDEILKAAVSKYGLNQWARVSSLLARKTPKQCKARWSEWLDPGIRKIEWSKEEDEKLLHLAKLMPTQWRTIAPIVGRTATQCLERYQRLLDEAEARESNELGLGGPSGAETQAPSADDVRKLRPGELDPDPESKPARPDTIDLDEDEKEMLSEARARLANTQGKKAKRKARERQLEDSRRMALLQKRRELKTAGINIKVTNKKPGQMDYNADIPFERKAALGFYDTTEESQINEKQRDAFDPRKQQLVNKRKSDLQQQEEPHSKKRKPDGEKQSGIFAAAAKAGQMQTMREAQQNSNRKPLNLPAPQIGEVELEDIVKVGLAGEEANRAAGAVNNDVTKGLVSNYSGIVGSTPIRTPRAPPQEDHIANEIHNIRALTETQSSLLGGENTPLHERSGTTGFDGIAPKSHVIATPNPMATPMRPPGVNGAHVLPAPGAGVTPLRTPRDKFALNQGPSTVTSATPRNLRQAENTRHADLRSQFANLPRPKELEFELELPEERPENEARPDALQEDAADRDRKERERHEAAQRAMFKRRTQVMQRNLPRPLSIKLDELIDEATKLPDSVDAMIMQEKALLMAHDLQRFPLANSTFEGSLRPLVSLEDEALTLAKLSIAQEASSSRSNAGLRDNFLDECAGLHADLHVADWHGSHIPQELVLANLDRIKSQLIVEADKGNSLEQKLSLHLGGYQKRATLLQTKIGQASDALEAEKVKLDAFRNLQAAEDAAVIRRVEALREEVSIVERRQAEAQSLYRQAMEQNETMRASEVAVANGG